MNVTNRTVQTNAQAERSLIDLAWVFFSISTVTLGGGMAMIPLMERAFVEKRRYLTSDEMLDIVAVMQSLPGLIAINMASLIGYRVCGVKGAIVSSVASVLSPFLVIVAVAAGLSALSDSPTVSHIFLGVRAGTAALILLSLVRLARQTCTSWGATLLGVISFVASVVFRVDLTLVILGGVGVGIGLIIANAVRRAR